MAAARSAPAVRNHRASATSGCSASELFLDRLGLAARPPARPAPTGQAGPRWSPARPCRGPAPKPAPARTGTLPTPAWRHRQRRSGAAAHPGDQPRDQSQPGAAFVVARRGSRLRPSGADGFARLTRDMAARRAARRGADRPAVRASGNCIRRWRLGKPGLRGQQAPLRSPQCWVRSKQSAPAAAAKAPDRAPAGRAAVRSVAIRARAHGHVPGNLGWAMKLCSSASIWPGWMVARLGSSPAATASSSSSCRAISASIPRTRAMISSLNTECSSLASRCRRIGAIVPISASPCANSSLRTASTAVSEGVGAGNCLVHVPTAIALVG